MILKISSLDTKKTIHLAGIAGSAMSGLAVLLKQRGFSVQGTDPNFESIKGRFKISGIPVFAEQDGSRIPENTGLVVASAALSPTHPELRVALERGIPVVTYAEFLGALMGESRGVAVAGTHGKTTTTAMILKVLETAKIDPSYVVGGIVSDSGESAKAGSSPIFVAEACEYKRSFLNLKPEIAVINNIEEDHLDVYGNLEEILDAFAQFARGIPGEGRLVYSAACGNTPRILGGLTCELASFGVEAPADYVACDLVVHKNRTDFTVEKNGHALQSMTIYSPGRHNVANGMAAALACRGLGVSWQQISDGLRDFRGVKRRFELRGEEGGVLVYDDYAHHPTEIRALLLGARERFPRRRITAVFQPHQLSRTRLLLPQFAGAFSSADRVIITDIYSVRDAEDEKHKVCAHTLVSAIGEHGVEVADGGDLANTVRLVSSLAEPGDVILTIGAGNIDTIIESLLAALKGKLGS